MTGFDSRSSASEDRRAEAAGSDISGMGRKKQMMPGRRGKKRRSRAHVFSSPLILGETFHSVVMRSFV